MQTSLAVDWTPDVNEINGSLFPKVVVLYEDVRAGEHAVRALRNTIYEPEADVQFRPQLWRFDILEDPHWFDLALADAIKADLVVITTSSKHQVNNTVNELIRLCLARKRGGSTAFAALLGPADEPDGLSSPRVRFLRNAVGEAGLDFFVPQPRHENSACSQRKHAPERGNCGANTRRCCGACNLKLGAS